MIKLGKITKVKDRYNRDCVEFNNGSMKRQRVVLNKYVKVPNSIFNLPNAAKSFQSWIEKQTGIVKWLNYEGEIDGQEYQVYNLVTATWLDKYIRNGKTWNNKQ
tara:strand:+ start:1299 stop:1610 length:312 start_codon:yes stop_codon:yes gene_type:complete